MVIHHLDSDFKEFPTLKAMVKKISTLLKPGGKLCISTMFQDTLKSLWFYNIHKESADKYFEKWVSRPKLKSFYEESGLINLQEVKCFEHLCGYQHYNATFPLSDELIRTLSFYTTVGENLGAYRKTLAVMLEKGTFPKYLHDCEERIKEFGAS